MEVNGRDENQGLRLPEEPRPNVRIYTKSGGGGRLVGLGQAGGGIFFIVDALDTKAKGYDVAISFPKEGIGSSAEAIALIKGAKNPRPARSSSTGRARRRCRTCSPSTRSTCRPIPTWQSEASLAQVLKGTRIFPIDADYAGANRKRVVERWIAEVLNP
ncbi:MAG: hypothetical protein IPJ62_18110 [Betaproteobacteria bacterium]|nr:hypothetical protein [Betaproteobacteria bacterium]